MQIVFLGDTRSVKSYFLGKKMKNISRCRLLKFLPSMQSVKGYGTLNMSRVWFTIFVDMHFRVLHKNWYSYQ